MKTKSKKIRWGAMTPAELAEATKEFDHPLPDSRYKPATKAQRARFERAMRAGTRGRELMASLVIDEKLASEAEAYAKKKKITVIQLIERGLRRELAVKD
jgi:macrodomain Ter protein organizer (MatP/YcbG family)